MFRTHLSGSLCAAIALGAILPAQQVVVTQNGTTDRLMSFSPVDGSLLSDDLFSLDDTTQVSATLVGNEVWVTQQIADRIVRYDVCGNRLGEIGPTFTGGGLDNIRGINFIGGVVYVCNDGGNNGATINSLVTFDTAGNHLGTLPLSDSPSPFSVIPFNGNLLVASSSAGDDVHEYTTAGVSVGLFHDSTSINFAHQIAPASDGNYWCATFTSDSIVKLDAATGNILSTFSTDNTRGVYELQNGNLLWTNSSGAYVYDVVSATSTLVVAGNCYHLNEVSLDFACHETLGSGCHAVFSDHFELFTDVASAQTALEGNVLQYTPSGNGYIANWIPAAAVPLFVAPSAGATIIANGSTTTESFTPSSPIPVPGGTAATWTVSSEGILTAAATGNQGTDTSPSLADVADETELAFYSWFSQNPTETGSGNIVWEEIGSVLYVTFDGVEISGGTPTASPSTYQWQIDMVSGNVLMLWVSFTPNSSAADVLVGCTLAGAGNTPVSQSLAAANGLVVAPEADLLPLTLSANPPPVINPNTLVTFTASNAPEFVPGSGVYVGTMFLSFTPLPGGVDLTGILASRPGCSAYIGSLDLALSAAVSTTPDLTWDVDFSNTLFFPGAFVGSQAIALFDSNFPLLNGEDSGLVFSNGLVSTTYAQ